jgi:alkaline phosphatase
MHGKPDQFSRRNACRACIAAAMILAGQMQARAASVRNVILCIGDGMGPEQVNAAGLYAGTHLFFESFPYQSRINTASAGSSVTDSAAAATAMATGTRVYNGVFSLRRPGDDREKETLLEYFMARGKAAGP